MLDARVKLIAITHVPTNGGLVNPAAAVGPGGAGGRRALSPRRLPVGGPDADRRGGARLRHALRPPAASICAGRAPPASSRSGGSFVERLEPPFLDLHAATWWRATATRCGRTRGASRTGKPTYAGKIGLGVAVDYALDWGLAGHPRARLRARRRASRERLAALPGVTVRDMGAERCGIVTFTARGLRGRRLIKQALLSQAINVSASQAAATRGSTWRPATCPGWCAPPCTTTTARTRSSASAPRWGRVLARYSAGPEGDGVVPGGGASRRCRRCPSSPPRPPAACGSPPKSRL